MKKRLNKKMKRSGHNLLYLHVCVCYTKRTVILLQLLHLYGFLKFLLYIFLSSLIHIPHTHTHSNEQLLYVAKKWLYSVHNNNKKNCIAEEKKSTFDIKQKKNPHFVSLFCLLSYIFNASFQLCERIVCIRFINNFIQSYTFTYKGHFCPEERKKKLFRLLLYVLLCVWIYVTFVQYFVCFFFYFVYYSSRTYT